MVRMRRWLGTVAVATVLLHGVVIGATTLVAVVHPEELPGLECTCDHGEHAMCPMHQPNRSDQDSTCRMQSTGDLSLAAISVLVPAVVPSLLAMAILETPGIPADALSTRFPLDLLRPPDAPPPRA